REGGFRDDRGPRREGGFRDDRGHSRDFERPRPFSRDEDDSSGSGTRARFGRPEYEEKRERETLPEMAADITADELEKEVRDELRSLPGDLAELVGRHLVAAERALEADDPDNAYEHTKVARRFAARIGVVREAAGIVAYRAGHFAEALSDLRAARRLTGSDAYLPVMADCERGLGRPERALDLVRSPEAERLDRSGRIELAIVESGARRDLGQHDAAVITLQRLPELRDPQARPWSARLAFAYADALAHAGHADAATDWFGRAMAFDEDGETDAAERYAELTGAVIEDVEEEFASDNDIPDAEALAEADDLLAPSSEGTSEDAESADSSAASSENEPVADDELPADEAPSSEEKPAKAEEKPATDEALSAGEKPVTVQEAEAAEPATVDAQTGESVDRREAAPAASAEDELAGGKHVEAEEPAGSSITPAFIEPDFGDILDEPKAPEERPNA
ncbi:hypothetical protein, partial [Nonomuraea longicatena]|uniref:hypothetical protein n=1 Tax=Nonomuraea longicatena TaxID=83682 RepID=UPI0031E23094